MRRRRLTPPSNLVNDLVGLHYPPLAAKLAERQVDDLIRRWRKGEISLKAALAQLRGAA